MDRHDSACSRRRDLHARQRLRGVSGASSGSLSGGHARVGDVPPASGSGAELRADGVASPRICGRRRRGRIQGGTRTDRSESSSRAPQHERGRRHRVAPPRRGSCRHRPANRGPVAPCRPACRVRRGRQPVPTTRRSRQFQDPAAHSRRRSRTDHPWPRLRPLAVQEVITYTHTAHRGASPAPSVRAAQKPR